MNCSRRFLKGCLLLATSCGFMAGIPAHAEGITFAVLNPTEYDLPTDGFRPFNAGVQYFEFNNATRRLDDDGREVKIPNSQSYVSLTKFVHFWTFDDVPDVGVAYEVIQPTVVLDTTGRTISGVGDTLTGPAIWYKPSKSATIGYQNFVGIPWGSKDVSNHYWANYGSFFLHWNAPKHLSFTGDIGAVIRGHQKRSGMRDVDPGNSYHANARLSWKSKSAVLPFVSFDWQKNKASRFVDGPTIAGTAGYDIALGGGFQWQVDKRFALTGRYSRSVSGRNTNITNAVYLSITKIF